MMNCPNCGKLTDPKLENCPHCGFLQKRSSPAERGGTQRQTCPRCHALVQDGDIICVSCGTNLLTGQKIAEERKLVREGAGPTTKIVAAVVVGIILVAGVGFAAFMLTRDPVRQALKLKAAGRLSEATKLLQDHTAGHPDDGHAFLELGKLEYATGQSKAAADSFEKAAGLNPGNREAALIAAVCLAAGGDAATRGREIGFLQELANTHQDDQQVWYLLALARGSRGDVSGQIEALKHVVSLPPADAGAAASAPRGFLGVALALQGDYPAAEQELGAALARDPDNGDAMAALGIVMALRGKPGEAQARLADAVKRRPAIESGALVRLGLLLISQGQYETAEGYLSRAKKLGANEAAQFFRGVALQGQGLFDSAIMEFEDLSKGMGPYAARAAVSLAQIYLAKGSLDKAREMADRAANMGNSGAPLLTVRGRILAQSNNEAGAQDMFKKAIQADPDYALAHLENGLLYVKRQVVAEGVRELERYLELVGAAVEGVRVEEIRGLVEQLKQTSGQTGPPGSTPARSLAGKDVS